MVQHKTIGEIEAIQFELWENCDNNCTFCYSKLDRVNCTPEQQINNILRAKSILAQEIHKFNGVGLIGGEFFQGQLKDPNVKQEFLSLIDYIDQLMQNGSVQELWLAATLTREKQDDLFETLQHITDHSKVIITTSYDADGRFHLVNGKTIWLNNLKKIKDTHPEISCHAQTIVTQSFIEETLNPQTNMIPAILQYSMIDFKLPSLYMKYSIEEINNEQNLTYRDIILKTLHLYPKKFFIEKRSDFLRFIYFIKETMGKEKLFALCTPKVRSKALYLLSKNSVNADRWDVETNTTELASCGHMKDSCGYLDSDRCARCDVQEIYEME